MRKQALLWIALLLMAGGTASAQQRAQVGQGGQTSGPAAGMNVIPSTVTQKLFEGRSSFIGSEEQTALEAGALAAGAPAVPGKPGTQSGGAPEGKESRPVY